MIVKKICFEMNDHSIIIKILVCKESNLTPNITFTVCNLSVWIGSVDIFSCYLSEVLDGVSFIFCANTKFA